MKFEEARSALAAPGGRVVIADLNEKGAVEAADELAGEQSAIGVRWFASG